MVARHSRIAAGRHLWQLAKAVPISGKMEELMAIGGNMDARVSDTGSARKEGVA
jgi:hypothetical protein